MEETHLSAGNYYSHIVTLKNGGPSELLRISSQWASWSHLHQFENNRTPVTSAELLLMNTEESWRKWSSVTWTDNFSWSQWELRGVQHLSGIGLVKKFQSKLFFSGKFGLKKQHFFKMCLFSMEKFNFSLKNECLKTEKFWTTYTSSSMMHHCHDVSLPLTTGWTLVHHRRCSLTGSPVYRD